MVSLKRDSACGPSSYIHIYLVLMPHFSSILYVYNELNFKSLLGKDFSFWRLFKNRVVYVIAS